MVPRHECSREARLDLSADKNVRVRANGTHLMEGCGARKREKEKERLPPSHLLPTPITIPPINLPHGIGQALLSRGKKNGARSQKASPRPDSSCARRPERKSERGRKKVEGRKD
uniref:Uncharacterized protein n=1 Tax=Pristionchus pacificus TaxID=54126 RepID=A0A2A6CDJ1_PRIPA|eukprot:PDM76186.1 hypothetical protein PRIPAC_39790 [Pristionchus pacificus]